MKWIFLVIMGFGILNAQIVKTSKNTITDTTTKLQWQDNSDVKTITRDWKGAIKYCKNLTINGHHDWRLPTIKEMKSIKLYKDGIPGMVDGFKNNTYGAYWSSTPYKGYPKFAWGLNYYSGFVGYVIKSYKGHVRCVRSVK